MNLEQDIFFKVYIIESPADIDLFENRTEGKALSNVLEISEIPYEYLLVTSEKTFELAFKSIKDDILELQEEYLFVWPIIHVSCHGNDSGIGLTDNSYLKWNVLYQMLTEVNLCFEEDPSSPIFLSMSSCFGLHAIKTDWDSESSPFAFVLGHEKEILWEDALIAFSVFYHNFVNKKKSSDIALACMNNSINAPGYFKLFNSKDIYNLF